MYSSVVSLNICIFRHMLFYYASLPTKNWLPCMTQRSNVRMLRWIVVHTTPSMNLSPSELSSQCGPGQNSCKCMDLFLVSQLHTIGPYVFVPLSHCFNYLDYVMYFVPVSNKKDKFPSYFSKLLQLFWWPFFPLQHKFRIFFQIPLKIYFSILT